MEYYQKLPHFDHEGYAFFVTARFVDSIPKKIIIQLIEERRNALDSIKNRGTRDAKRLVTQLENEFFRKFDQVLDEASYGETWLTEGECPQILKEIMFEWDGQYYDLLAYVIMQNHIHLVLDLGVQLVGKSEIPADYQHLHTVMRRIKSKSAVFMNRHRNRQGQVWDNESYDRYIRDANHEVQVINYTLLNPVNAGICKQWRDYPFSYVKDDLWSLVY